MNSLGKYLVNFKAPIGNVEASLSVSGDDPFQVIQDARQLLALARQEPEAAPAQPVTPRQDTAQPPAATSQPAANGHHEQAATAECPIHHRALKSQFGDWLYCPELTDDDTRCKWNTKPKKAAR